MDVFTDPETREAIREEAFSTGKQISDFVGMILRLVFLVVAGFYFYNAMGSATPSWLNFVFGMCMMSTATLAVYLFSAVVRIILWWEFRDLGKLSPIAALVLAILSGVLVLITTAGLSLLVLDLAEAAMIHRSQ